MENIIRQTTKLALHIVRPYVTPDAAVIDATCGNGHDTLALAGMQPAKLYAFDIQEEAVRSAIKLLDENGYRKSLSAGRFTVEQLAHENLLAYFESSHPTCSNPIRAILFNLGYLPGGDKTITTRTDSTLAAVQAAMDLIAPDGLICITMYSGHPEGLKEKAALLDFASELDAGKWHTAYISMPNQKHDPPEILLITRKR